MNIVTLLLTIFIILVIPNGFILIFVLCFLIPNIQKNRRREQREVEKALLDKKNIIFESEAARDLLILIPFSLVFFTFGGLMICSFIHTGVDTSSSVVTLIFGIILCFIPTIIILNKLIIIIKILKGKYVIVIDELKYIYYNSDYDYDSESNYSDRSAWYLYFKDFFKAYDKRVLVNNYRDGNKYRKGNKFYLVFLKGSKEPYIFSFKEYTLPPEAKDKLKNLDEIKDYINIKKINLKSNNDNIIINKSQIKKDFNRLGHKKTAIFFTLISISMLILISTILVLIAKNLISISFEYIIALIIMPLMLIFDIFMSFIKIKYVCQIYSNIRKGNIKIIEDEVIALNRNISYVYSNKMISFKFKNYNKLFYADKKEYSDIKIGDKFYLVFVKGENNVIKAYDAKRSTLDKNLEHYLK